MAFTAFRKKKEQVEFRFSEGFYFSISEKIGYPSENGLAADVASPLLVIAHVVENLSLVLDPLLVVKSIHRLVAVSTPIFF